VEAHVVEHGADRPAGRRQVDVGRAVDGRPAGVGAGEAQQHPQGRRLAGAVGPEEPGHLAGRRAEADAVDRRGPAVALHHVHYLDHGDLLTCLGRS
jgi:hypothetical protein